MARFDFEPIPRNVRALARTKRAHDMLVWRGQRVRSALGVGFELEEYLGRTRWRISVRAESAAARARAARHPERMISALSAARVAGKGESD